MLLLSGHSYNINDNPHCNFATQFSRIYFKNENFDWNTRVSVEKHFFSILSIPMIRNIKHSEQARNFGINVAYRALKMYCESKYFDVKIKARKH